MCTDHSPTLLAALRAGTRDLHARSEAAFVLGGPAVTRAVYADVVERLMTFYAVAERTLAYWASALADCGLDLAARRKAPLLRRDLRVLGRALGPGADLGAATATALGAGLPSAAHAWGVLYVLEGATLGGQLLRRRLGPALGLTPARGLAFFAAYGDDVGPMWRAFTAALDRFDQSVPVPDRPAARAAAVAGARTAFLAFERDVVAPTAVPDAMPGDSLDTPPAVAPPAPAAA